MAFYNQHLHTTRTVLFEAEERSEKMNGFTDNYVKVQVPYNSDLVNQTIEVQLDAIHSTGVVDILLPVESN